MTLFLESWVPLMTGHRRLAVLADVWGEPGQFMVFCTDGRSVFRVGGSKSLDLAHLLAGMTTCGFAFLKPEGDLHAPIAAPCDVILRPPPIPCTQTIQAMFDSELEEASIAA
ncbi:MAG TPA: hypothetical protein VIG99_31480 [Myxococcaceae bacterium]